MPKVNLLKMRRARVMDKRRKPRIGLDSAILSFAARYLLPLLLLFSVFILFRGHNKPGGGFVGGLVAAAGFALYTLAQGVERARAVLPAAPRALIALGLFVAVGSALASLAFGAEFMQGVWSKAELPGIGKLGTPLFFDIGVYIVVLGVVVNVVFTFFGEQEEL